MSLRAHFAKQSPNRLGDCFVAKIAPRNDGSYEDLCLLRLRETESPLK
jgi:hypothetical protein